MPLTTAGRHDVAGDRPGSGSSAFRVFLQGLPDEIAKARQRGTPIRFPDELLPDESGRREAATRLLESIGVELVGNDTKLVDEGREQLRQHLAALAAANARLRRERSRHDKSVSNANGRTAHMPYRAKPRLKEDEVEHHG